MKTLVGAAAVALLVAFIPAAASAAPLTVTCNGGACSGWFRTNVVVAFHWDTSDPSITSTPGCGTFTQSTDTPGQPYTCTLNFNNGPPYSVSTTVAKDSTPPTVTAAALARGPDANGWYRSPVGVSFTGSDATSGIAGCTSASYAGPDTSGTVVHGTCTDNAGNVSAAASSPSIKYDATPPAVSVSLARGPDSNGWYNHPVGFAARGSDNLSGVASCNSGTFGGGSGVSASCTDNAGNVGSAGVPIQYDAGAPSVDGVSPDRPPDSDGWYNHPVTVTYRGSDGGSGIASCTSTTYKGPDTTDATINGTCTDKAGNKANGQGFHLKYDSTPPTITNVGVTANDRFVSLTWTASPDTKSLSVTRAPGTTGLAPSTLFTGPGGRYDDRTVVNKTKYTYTITAADDAGNKAVETVTVTPAALLYSPAQGATVRSLPLLAWRPIKGASYYNVQVFYTGRALASTSSPNVAGRKILSAWPFKPHYRIKKSWKFKKLVRRLVPGGHYTWIVFPGYGKRSANKYGPIIGHSDFIFVGAKR